MAENMLPAKHRTMRLRGKVLLLPKTKRLMHMIRMASKTVFYFPKFKAQKCKYSFKKINIFQK